LHLINKKYNNQSVVDLQCQLQDTLNEMAKLKMELEYYKNKYALAETKIANLLSSL
jgi:hypothetical protein